MKNYGAIFSVFWGERGPVIYCEWDVCSDCTEQQWPLCTVYLYIFSMSPLPLQIAIHAFCNYLHILCYTTCISDCIFIFKLLFYDLLFSRSSLPFHMSSGSKLEPEHHTKIGYTKGLWSWEHQILKLRYVKVTKNIKGSQLCLCRRYELIIE